MHHLSKAFCAVLLEHEVSHFWLLSIFLSQLRFKEGVVEKAHVEDEVRFWGDPVFEAEGDESHAHSPIEAFAKGFLDEASEVGDSKAGGVEHEVRQRLQ